MRTDKFFYNLPSKFIAQEPVSPRDTSNLLVLDKKNGRVTHSKFLNLAKFLEKGDTLIFNNSKVFPAKISGTKESGGKAEILLLSPQKGMGESLDWEQKWRILGKGRLKKGTSLTFSKKLKGKIAEDLGKEKIMEFNLFGENLKKEVFRIGKPPTPPYIKKRERGTKKKYQTIYAQKIGSVAAPTAGFHFTRRVFSALKKKGIKTEYITLHIGIGTFLPVKTRQVEEHNMAAEWAKITAKTAAVLNKQKEKGRRIISVGTTAARALEYFSNPAGEIKSGQGFANLFITPGYKFKIIDGMITNFHLPRSTPLLLASSLSSWESIKNAYEEAKLRGYRFYSFGDAMLIL